MSALYTDIRLYVMAHPGATKDEVAEAMGVSGHMAARQLNILACRGFVERAPRNGPELRYLPGRLPEKRRGWKRRTWTMPLDGTPKTTRQLVEETGQSLSSIREVLYSMERDGTAICDRTHRPPYTWTAPRGDAE